MKRSLLIWILFVVVLTAPLPRVAQATGPSGQTTPLQEILILNSYHPGYTWSDEEQAGILDVFRAKGKNWFPVIEYLDLRRLRDGKYLSELKKLFGIKYQNRKFSVIIALDNPALKFAIDNQTGLFRNTPIVFCGVNNFSPALLKGHTKVTGIVEAVDIAGTIEVMLRLHPDAREIFCLNDYTVSGLAIRKEVEALIPRFGSKVRFRFNNPLNMDELLKELERLPRNSLVFMAAFITEKSGRTFDASETTRLFYEHSPVPIYSTYGQRLGFGIVGGKLLSARVHGVHAARIALRVLAGEKASAIPVVLMSDAQFMFDYNVMSRFGIPLSALPEGSTVINKPISFYAAHRVLVQGVLGIMSFLILIIVLLVTNIAPRKRSAEMLRKNENEYRELIDGINDTIWVIDFGANLIDVNKSAVASLGYSKEELLATGLHGIDSSLNRDDIKALAGAMPSDRIQIFETSHRTKDGRTFPVEVSSSLVTYRGNPAILSIARDITGRKQVEKTLRENDERFNQLAEQTGTFVWEVDAQGLYTYVSHMSETVLGYRPDELVGRMHFYDLHPEVGRDVFKEAAFAVFKSKEFFRDLENAAQTKDGRHVWISTNGIPLLDTDGTLRAYRGSDTDITERKRAKEELHRSEENFRRSLDDSPLGVRVVTEEGDTVYANRAILDIYGLDTLEELKTTPLEKRYVPESFAEHQVRKEKRKRGDYCPSEYDISIISKGDKIRHLQVFRKEILWNGERQFQVIYRDITEHKQAMDLLRESHEQLRDAHRLAHIGVWNWTADTDTVTWTEELYRIAGLDPMLPAPTYAEHSNIYAPESWDRLKEAVERAMKTGATYELELELIRPDGTTRWVNAFGGAKHDDNGRVTGLHGTLQDITALRQAAEALRESELRYRELFDNISSGVAIYEERDNGNDFVFKDFNKAGERLDGDRKEDVIGKSVRQARPGIEAFGLLNVFKRVWKTGIPEHYPVSFYEDERLKRWFENYVYKLPAGDIVAVYDDVTDRRRAEEALRTSHVHLRALTGRLQAVREEQRTNVAREIHDELGGALTGLKIDCSFLVRSALQIRSDTVRTSLLAGMDLIMKSIDAMIQTVRRIAMELRPGVLDDLGLIAALEWQLNDFQKRTGIRCEFFPPVGDMSLDDDISTALFRIFQEALTNVVRHSGATEVSVRLRADADSCILEIKDNGKGIEKKNVRSSKSLGLLGMRERVLIFGGRITITGTPGTGTKLMVEVPPVEKRKMNRNQEGEGR